MGVELLLFLLSWHTLASAEPNEVIRPECPSKCGNVAIPYPFGIGIGSKCSIDTWADINCSHTFNPPRPFIYDLEVISISVGEVRIKNYIATKCYDSWGIITTDNTAGFSLEGTPYTFSSTRNKFFAIGCNFFFRVSQYVDDGNYLWGCASICYKIEDVMEGPCSGIGCCQTSIPKGFHNFSASVERYGSEAPSFDPCVSGFLAEEDKYTLNKSDFTNTDRLLDIPIVLNFAIGKQTCEDAKKDRAKYACKGNSDCCDSPDATGYFCNCSMGYEGNPYLGCHDVNECADPSNNPCKLGTCNNTAGSYNCTCPSDYHGDGGKDGIGCIKNNPKAPKSPVLPLTLGLGFGFLFILAVGSCLYFSMKKRKLFKMKEKFFQQNGGLLLKQQITSHEGGAESTKIFTTKELAVATNNYDESRILGHGASGTVYKGNLPDRRTVAIKKSKTIDSSQVGQFINEVAILTQINHRNVVKLLGCCLETKVPLLVYEFVSNGTLFHHLHKRSSALPSLSWRGRLRIAAETAGALAYLHSAASIPIIHRDVKSANILLDDNYIAKVADFGASRLNHSDATEISTLVQGTMGYLDPEYFHSGQLTEKSDVYSFGVVLAELLTGEKPLCNEGSEERRHLATYFVASMKNGRLFKILEAGVVNEGSSDQVVAVAQLAKRCLNLEGEKRPSMKEVAAELEALRGFEKRQKNYEDNMGLTANHVDLYDPIPLDSCSSNGGTSRKYNPMTIEMIGSMNVPR